MALYWLFTLFTIFFAAKKSIQIWDLDLQTYKVIQEDKKWDVGACFFNSYGTSLFLIVSISFKWSLPMLSLNLVNITTLLEPTQYPFIRCNMLQSLHYPFDDHFIQRTFLFSDLRNSALPVSSHFSENSFQNFHSDIRPYKAMAL